MVLFWLIVAFISFLLEMTSPGLFYFLSVTLGSGAAALAALMGAEASLQGIIFLGMAILAFLLLPKVIDRPLLPYQATNAQALVGKEGVVIEPIAPGIAGLVKIGGQEWMAKSSTQSLHSGDRCVVKKVVGCHVVVHAVSLHT